METRHSLLAMKRLPPSEGEDDGSPRDRLANGERSDGEV
jgi:hypothetical protein